MANFSEASAQADAKIRVTKWELAWPRPRQWPRHVCEKKPHNLLLLKTEIKAFPRITRQPLFTPTSPLRSRCGSCPYLKNILPIPDLISRLLGFKKTKQNEKKTIVPFPSFLIFRILSWNRTIFSIHEFPFSNLFEAWPAKVNPNFIFKDSSYCTLSALFTNPKKEERNYIYSPFVMTRAYFSLIFFSQNSAVMIFRAELMCYSAECSSFALMFCFFALSFLHRSSGNICALSVVSTDIQKRVIKPRVTRQIRKLACHRANWSWIW